MAENLNSEPVNGMEHNAGARGDSIRNGFGSMYSLENQIAEAIERHVQPLKDTLKRQKRSLKKDLDMELADINLQYKLYKRARVAHEEFEDGEDGNKVLDNLRELHEALHPGETVDWIAAIEATVPQPGLPGA